MVDVFVSYARDQRQVVERLNEDLKLSGFTTFFDIDDIQGGDEFPDRIDTEIRSAKCVLGCWSKSAFARPWVRRECRIGQLRGVLVPIAIQRFDELDMHIQFIDTNYIDFTDYRGPDTHHGWPNLLSAISRHAGSGDDGSHAGSPDKQSVGRQLAIQWIRSVEGLYPSIFPVGDWDATTHLPDIPEGADQNYLAERIVEIDVLRMQEDPPRPDIEYYFPDLGAPCSEQSKVVIHDKSPRTGKIVRCVKPGWHGYYVNRDTVGHGLPVVFLDGS